MTNTPNFNEIGTTLLAYGKQISEYIQNYTGVDKIEFRLLIHDEPVIIEARLRRNGCHTTLYWNPIEENNADSLEWRCKRAKDHLDRKDARVTEQSERYSTRH